MNTADDPATAVQRWPLWTGAVLVVLSSAIIVAVFALSVQSSSRSATERVLAQQTLTRLHMAETDLRDATSELAAAIARRDQRPLRPATEHAWSAIRTLRGEGAPLAGLTDDWMRRFYASVTAAYSNDWPRSGDAFTQLAAERRLPRTLTHVIERERMRWESADAGMMVSDARSRGFALPVAAAGGLLVLAAGLLGYLAAQALRLYGSAKRRGEHDQRRAEDLQAAVDDRTADLLAANAQLEREMQERGAAEAQLRQAHKMEAIGQLTGGIAHDFNNMLAVVVGGIELARRRTGDPSAVARQLDRAMEGADRAVALTRRLLSFARAEPANAQPLSLTELVLGLGDMVERTLDERIVVTLDCDPDLPPARVDRHQMENAILNLVVNARDAMPAGGELSIRTRALAGDRVELTVRDTGGGMDEATRDRAMEPFFTTKPAGQGTGLGLSQIFGLVRATDGDMRIDSAPGQGTAVVITLPADPTVALPERAAPTSADVPTVHRLSVLVVEDDARVRRATVSALAELGHRPLACTDGAAALALVRGGTDVDLLVSDVVMPGLSGPALAAELQRLGLQTPILFVTGYAAGADDDQLSRHQVIRKPFTLNQLSSGIARAWERSASVQVA